MEDPPSSSSKEIPDPERYCYGCGEELRNPDWCWACGRYQITECRRCGTSYRKILGKCPNCGLLRRRSRSSRRHRKRWYHKLQDLYSQPGVRIFWSLIFLLGILVGFWLYNR